MLAGPGALMGWLCACGNPSTGAPQPGDRFPAIALPTLDGERESLSDYTGTAVLIHFWATWCEPCRREMPGLEILGTLFDPRDLRIIAVAADDDLDLVREFRLRYRIGFSIWSDADRHLSGSILRVPAFPTTYLLRRNHSIAKIVVGERRWTSEAVVAEIETLLQVRRASRAPAAVAAAGVLPS